MFITHLLHSVLSLLNLIQAQQWITDLSRTMTQTQHQQDFKSRAGWWHPILMPLPWCFRRVPTSSDSAEPCAHHGSWGGSFASFPALSLGTCYVPSAASLLFWLKPFPLLWKLANIFHWSETLFIQLIKLTVHLLCSCRHSNSTISITGLGCLAWQNHSSHMR